MCVSQTGEVCKSKDLNSSQKKIWSENPVQTPQNKAKIWDIYGHLTMYISK